MKLTITGAPTTKKNSGIVTHSGAKCPTCKRGMGRAFVLPSHQYQAWEKSARRELLPQLAGLAHAPSCPCRRCALAAPPAGEDPQPVYLDVDVNCRALIYREKAVGDANNYYGAIADALEAAGVVKNDRLIVSWDGSRLLKDAEHPRVEILLVPVDDATHSVVRRWRPRAAQAQLPMPAPEPSPLQDDDIPIR